MLTGMFNVSIVSIVRVTPIARISDSFIGTRKCSMSPNLWSLSERKVSMSLSSGVLSRGTSGQCVHVCQACVISTLKHFRVGNWRA